MVLLKPKVQYLFSDSPDGRKHPFVLGFRTKDISSSGKMDYCKSNDHSLLKKIINIDMLSGK